MARVVWPDAGCSGFTAEIDIHGMNLPSSWPSALAPLTEHENSLIEAVKGGEELRCSDSDVAGALDEGSAAPAIRAAVIRELLLDRDRQLDPRGVRIRGASITGDLNLDHMSVSYGLSLVNCEISGEIRAEYAKIGGIDLSGSRFTSIHADGLRVDGDMVLEGAVGHSDRDSGTVRMILAHVTGQFICDGLKISNASGPCMIMDGVKIGADLFFREMEARGAGDNGAIRISVANVGGQLTFHNSAIYNPSGPAVIGDGMKVGGNLYLISVRASGTGDLGALRLMNASAGGQMLINELVVENSSGPALNADGLKADSDLMWRNLTIRGNHELGTVRVQGMRVAKIFEFIKSSISNGCGVALDCEGAKLGAVRFYDVALSGSGNRGALRLAGVHLEHALTMTDLRVTNESGPAIHCEGIQVKGNLAWTRVRATGSSEIGLVRLSGARISEQMDFTDVAIENMDGTALHADGLEVGANFRMGLTARGAGINGTIRLPGAKISGQLTCLDLRLQGGRYGLEWEGLKVGSSLLLPYKTICPALGRGEQCDNEDNFRINVDECSYVSLGRSDWRQWLHFLKHHSFAYQAQPYQQLASVEKSNGHDGYARHVLIAQQYDRRERARKSFDGKPAWLLHGLFGVVAGFGYRTSRLVGVLLAVLLSAGLSGYVAGQIDTRPGHLVAERTGQAGALPNSAQGIPCSSVELIGLGIDRGLPLGSTGLRSRCDLDTSTRWGQAFTLLIWAIQASLWLLATLAIAGYTNLVRKFS